MMQRMMVFAVVAAFGLVGANAASQDLFVITEPGDPVQGVPDDGNWPDNESPDLAFDQDAGTKYLHFSGENTGVRVTPSQNDVVVKALNFRAANDVPGRDPVFFQLSGSNEGIDGPYELIAEGEIADLNQDDAWPRDTWISEPIEIDNDQVYEHYEIFFPELRDPDDDGLMQINEIELLSDGSRGIVDVPPSTSVIIAPGGSATLGPVLLHEDYEADATYEWFFEGDLLEGETGDGLFIEDATAEQSGTYTVVVRHPDHEDPIAEFDIEVRVFESQAPAAGVLGLGALAGALALLGGVRRMRK